MPQYGGVGIFLLAAGAGRERDGSETEAGRGCSTGTERMQSYFTKLIVSCNNNNTNRKEMQNRTSLYPKPLTRAHSTRSPSIPHPTTTPTFSTTRSPSHSALSPSPLKKSVPS